MSGTDKQTNIILRGLKGLMKGAIRGYQLFIAGIFPQCCRFEPNCSRYSMEAIDRHGPIKGLGLTIWRILRCNPWNEGGYDPVPHVHCNHHSHHHGTDVHTPSAGR